MYADFVAYRANKAVVWGGHSGNLTKFEEFFPVLRKPLEYFIERYRVDYVLLDQKYASPESLGVESSELAPLQNFGSIVIYEFAHRPAVLQPDLAGH
jgi:hypothetical protein